MTLSAPTWGNRLAAGLSAALVLAGTFVLPASAAPADEPTTATATVPVADLLDVDFHAQEDNASVSPLALADKCGERYVGVGR